MAGRADKRGAGQAGKGGRRRERAGAEDPLEVLRRTIDDIDRRMVRLLNERAGCAIALGRVKKIRGMPIYQPAREEEVLRNVQGCNGGPLEEGALRRLFERIIDESRRIERIGTAEPDSQAASQVAGRDPEE